MSRITDDERAAIVATLHDLDGAVRETARRHGRGESTISRIAKAAGIEPAARARTKSACEANRVDNQARRAALARDLLGDAERLRGQLFGPCTVFSFGGRENVYREHELQRPPAGDQRAIVAALRMAVSTSLDLDRAGADDHAEARGLLERLVDNLDSLAEAS